MLEYVILRLGKRLPGPVDVRALVHHPRVLHLVLRGAVACGERDGGHIGRAGGLCGSLLRRGDELSQDP